MLVMFPTVMEFAVTPTSVAPPLPPAGAAVPAVDPPPEDPPLELVPALPAVPPDNPLVPLAADPPVPADPAVAVPEAPLPDAPPDPVEPPPPAPSAVFIALPLNREPQALTNRAVIANRTTAPFRLPLPRRCSRFPLSIVSRSWMPVMAQSPFSVPSRPRRGCPSRPPWSERGLSPAASVRVGRSFGPIRPCGDGSRGAPGKSSRPRTRSLRRSPGRPRGDRRR